MSGQVGLKRLRVSKHKVSLKGLPASCGRLFLDSGSHSLYTRYALPRPGSNKYRYYVKDGRWTRRFKAYMDSYADFVLQHKDCFDVYVTVDVIRHPKLCWESYKYLRDKGLKPMPVVHELTPEQVHTPLKWVDKYLDAGCTYIGIGGLGQESNRIAYMDWADKVFDHLCPRPSRLPIVRTHGFAMTSVPLMVRYPWYSVDSSRWAKAAGYSSILVPVKRNGEFILGESFLVCFSHRKESLERTGPHISKLPPLARRNVLDWLDAIDVPLGKSKGERPVKYGVISQYHARAVANLRYFERLAGWLPKWPWAFKVHVPRGLFTKRS